MPKLKTVSSHLFVVKLCLIAAFVCVNSLDVFAQTPRKIAFTYGSAGMASSVAVINEDGTGLVVFGNGGIDRDPAWSPDGSQIVFSGNRSGGVNIIRMNADGTGQVPLTASVAPVDNGEPAWSPDGTRIAFTRSQDHRNEIWVMNADGTNQIKLTTNPQLGTDLGGPVYGRDFGPAWSPDGTRIAFWSFRDDLTNAEIYTMNADGTNQLRLTNSVAEDRDPFWSRDGQHIAYFSSGPKKTDGIYEIDLNGANDHLLTTGSTGDWSPDGQKLAVTDFDPVASALALYVSNADGTNRVRITNTGTVDSSVPAWQTLGGPAPPPPPGGPLYTVTGKVLDMSLTPSGTGVAGITVSLTGSLTATATTDANGSYSFNGLPENGNFTLTPTSSSWSFSPANRAFSTSAPLVGFIGRNIDVQFSAAPIVLLFSTDVFTDVEGASAFVTVQRSGSILGTSTVQYATSNGTAVAGSDYTATSGTLTFNPFESSKNFLVPLIYDKTSEPEETINLTLSNATGGIIRGRQTAVLKVSDPGPQLLLQPSSSLASALNADTLVQDPFARMTSVLGVTTQTRVVLFAKFVDLLPGETLTVVGVEPNQVEHDLPVDFVGKVPGMDELTQIVVRLPANLPSGEIFVRLKLRGVSSNTGTIRITP